MANTRSAEKRIRQTEIHRARNRAQRAQMRTAVKELRGALANGEVEKAQELLPQTLGLIDRTAQKSAIHSRTADRTKSRLARAVAAASNK
ncbi:MAG TPA: 30S ribosomal protein S20 [Candidatus Krumholzibacteria bacterium]|nr:30S ribosomal protein S20 [Candidatus Krumholzibacteria bacterium]